MGERWSGLTVHWTLHVGREVRLGLNQDQGQCVEFLDRNILPLSTHVYITGTGEFSVGGNPVMDSHPIQSGVETPLVTSTQTVNNLHWYGDVYVPPFFLKKTISKKINFGISSSFCKYELGEYCNFTRFNYMYVWLTWRHGLVSTCEPWMPLLGTDPCYTATLCLLPTWYDKLNIILKN